jgi:hypothetical protein
MSAEILTAIDQNNARRANLVMEDADELEGYPERIEPKLFAAAEQCYREGDHSGACDILRFMKQYYPADPAVREALLLSLFLERTKQQAPDPALIEEINVELEGLQLRTPILPAWIKLLDTQISIDVGDISRAAESLNAYLSSGDIDPRLADYVEELWRFIQSH